MSNLRTFFRATVETTETKSGRAFDAVIQSLIVLSLVAYAFETLPGLDNSRIFTLRIIELTCIGIFTIAYALRIWVAEKPTKYIFSFYGLIDLAAIAPFYISTGLDLRSLRAVRLLRILRVLKLVRFNEAIKRIDVAFDLAKAELALFVSASTVVIYLAGVGIYHFENEAQPDLFSSIPDSLWFVVQRTLEFTRLVDAACPSVPNFRSIVTYVPQSLWKPPLSVHTFLSLNQISS